MNKKLLSLRFGVTALILLIILSAVQKATAVSVKDYGAVGNGSTNDAPAINSAISALPAGTDLYFPPGNYRISSTVTISKPMNILGAGRAGSVLAADAGVTALVVSYPVNDVRIQDLGVYSTGLTRTAGSSGIRAAPPSLTLALVTS